MPKERASNDAEWMERAEEYMEAAREHFLALQEMGDNPSHYPLAYYLAGLAIECLFRAYTELIGSEHDAGHDLRRDAEVGNFFRLHARIAEGWLKGGLGRSQVALA